TIDGAAAAGAPTGLALVVDAERKLLGLITDGDVRAALVSGRSLDVVAEDIMTRQPVTVRPGLTPGDTLREMTEQVRRSAHIRNSNRVQHLVVTDEAGVVVDVLDTFDLLQRMDVTNWSVGVIGLGFVGLTLAVSLSEVGYLVHGIDVNAQIAERIADGEPHFHEVGLVPLLKHHLKGERFHVHTELPAGVDVYIVAVGTPIGPDGRPILRSVQAAARSIGAQLKRGDLVLLRSTVPVGTTRNEVLPILEAESGLKGGRDFQLAFAPERTVEGDALNELRTLPQIVGGLTPHCKEVATQFFSKLAPNIVGVDSLESAEMAKLINNSFRDLSFAFANEFAMICDLWDIDAVRVIRAANTGYPRNRIPLPSPGVGGFCLTKDPIIFAWAGRDKGYEPKLPVDGRAVNEAIVDRVGEKVTRHFKRLGEKTEGKKVFVVGFAFKGRPETSDIRHSTTLDLLPALKDAGFDLYGYDPVVSADDVATTGVTPQELEAGFQDADAVIVMNNHPSYAKWDLPHLLGLTRTPALFFDGWHMFERADVERITGITYEGLSGAR
ncbi:MAG: nucleotide sugar dehydrogenase, partial [Bacteroidota bacterium]